MRISVLFKKAWLSLMLVSPLFDYLVLKNSIPIATILFYALSILVFGVIQSYYPIVPLGIILFYLFSSIINAVQNNSWNEDYLSIIAIILIGMLSMRILLINQYYDYLLSFTLFYFILSILIFIYRYYYLGLSIYETRSNGAFFGGNTAQFEYLLMFFLAVEYGKQKDAIVLFIICMLNSLIFVSKGALLIQIVLLAYYLALSKSIPIQWKVPLAGGCAVATYYLFTTELFAIFSSRFLIWRNSILRGEGLLGVRGLLFKDTFRDILNNPFIAIFGGGLGRFHYINRWSYTNPHNLLLDVYFCGGVGAIILFIYIILRIFTLCKNKICYLIVMLYGIVEGIQLLYVDNYSKWMFGATFIYIICIYNTVAVKQNRGIIFISLK